MLAAAASGAIEGDWLIADCQTAGRGRMGRLWESQTGNFYGSCLICLRHGDPDAATLALVAAIALHESVAIWAPAIRLKWPNDLLSADGAKLSGILLERAGAVVVVGFGVNLASHPKALDRPVTSIAAMGVTPPDPGIFVEMLAGILAHWVERWRSERLKVIRTAWLARAHPNGTALVASLPDGEQIKGHFDGLTEECALQLRLADGALRVIHAGDVFLI